MGVFPHKFELGNTWGSTPVFKTVEEFQAKILDAFEYMRGETIKKKRKVKDVNTGEIVEVEYEEVVRPSERPTITKIALFCGFESRTSFYNQGKRSAEFLYTVSRTKSAVEAGLEPSLFNKEEHAGAAFLLKSMGGWDDRCAPDPIKPMEKEQGEVKSNVLEELSGAQLMELIDKLPEIIEKIGSK